jgi:branched-chain amino acid transport system ATP-binding protein
MTTPPVTGCLSVEDVAVVFGGVVALDGVSMRVQRGEICGLIGPNGAGKTTLFNCISRFIQPLRGAIFWGGIDLLQRRSHEMVEVDIARTFQNLGLVPELTVLQNISLGGYPRFGTGFARAAAGKLLGRGRAAKATIEEHSSRLAEQLALTSVVNTPCSELPFGTLKRVELARALLTEPDLLLLDEPANGLTHGEVAELSSLLGDIRESHGLTMLLVEHHMGLVMGLCDHVVVFDSGRVIADGTPTDVRSNRAVIAAYLGA